MTHFSEQMTKNSQLRKELETLHVEQIRFQQLRNRLEKVGPEICFSLVGFNTCLCVNVQFYVCYIQELSDLRKKISGAVNCSIAAYDDR